MKFKLHDYKKFKEEYWNDGHVNWLHSLRAHGYPSTNQVYIGNDVFEGDCVYEMDDIEFTHFVLRWS